MKVKVQYTVEVDHFARCGIGMHFGEKANRDDIKWFLTRDPYTNKEADNVLKFFKSTVKNLSRNQIIQIFNYFIK